MAVFEWVRFLAGGALLLCGLGIFLIEMIGVFRFRYVLNRMHAAAMGDTLGIGFSLLGLILMCGFNFTSLKLLLVIIFLWFSSPTSSHLIARLEVTTDEDPEEHYRRVSLRELERELAAGKGGKKESVDSSGASVSGKADGKTGAGRKLATGKKDSADDFGEEVSGKAGGKSEPRQKLYDRETAVAGAATGRSKEAQ